MTGARNTIRHVAFPNCLSPPKIQFKQTFRQFRFGHTFSRRYGNVRQVQLPRFNRSWIVSVQKFRHIWPGLHSKIAISDVVIILWIFRALVWCELLWERRASSVPVRLCLQATVCLTAFLIKQARGRRARCMTVGPWTICRLLSCLNN